MKNLRWYRSIALITMALLSVVGEVRGESARPTHASTAQTAAHGMATPVAMVQVHTR